MDTILPSLANNAASLGLSGPDASNLTAAAGSTAAASSPTRGDTVTFSAEGLAKAAAMASNAATASNAGAGLEAKGQVLGAGQSEGEDATQADATVAALKARVEQIQEEIKAAEEDDLPRKERDAKLAELRLELLEAQTAYYKAKQQAGNDQGGSASQTAAAMAGLA